MAVVIAVPSNKPQAWRCSVTQWISLGTCKILYKSFLNHFSFWRKSLSNSIQYMFHYLESINNYFPSNIWDMLMYFLFCVSLSYYSVLNNKTERILIMLSFSPPKDLSLIDVKTIVTEGNPLRLLQQLLIFRKTTIVLQGLCSSI